jgi:predicted Zn-dependent protease
MTIRRKEHVTWLVEENSKWYTIIITGITRAMRSFLLLLTLLIPIGTSSPDYTWIRTPEQVQNVMDRLNQANESDFELYVSGNTEVNAYALVQYGIVLVNYGMIQFTSAQDGMAMLAFVMAHEMIHANYRHEVTGKECSQLREQELQADKEGKELITKAGFNPEGAVEYFKLHMEVFGDNENCGHPSTVERIKQLQQ